MIKYIIIVVVVLFALYIAGIIIKQKHKKEIARLEKEKVQIQHYPIFEELTKVKALNMNGQTEEMFETWRSQWTEVIDVAVVKMDAMLFDIEEQLDRFQFKKATLLEDKVQANINECEGRRVSILKELDELIGSEEKNRIEVEQLKDYHRSARKTILAHQHSFGAALPNLEKRLEAFPPRFMEFDELTAQGNYLQARETVLTLNSDAQNIFTLLTDIPTVLADLQTKIPSAIHELRNGQREMEEQSYYIGHLELGGFLDGLENELDELRESVAQLEIEKVSSRINEIFNEIDKMYDQLELEVRAKAYVDRECEPALGLLLDTLRFTKDMTDETAFVQHSYRLTEKDSEIPKLGLKHLESIQKRYDVLATRVIEGKSASSSLQEELREMVMEIEQIKAVQEDFAETLKNLRVDEHKARKQLNEMKNILQNTDRMLNRAKMPGIPEEMDARLEEAEERIFVVVQSLEEVPLNMEQVHANLELAQRVIEDVKTRAEEMTVNVLIIERLIQYGNRYRASNPQLNQKLLEAEDAFRKCRYVKALEDAATAVDQADPGALKKIEAMVQEELTVKS